MSEQEEIRLDIINKCRDSFIYLGKVLDTKKKTFYKDSPDFHYEIEKVLLNKGTWVKDPTVPEELRAIEAKFIHKESDNKKICIQAPRAYAKSTLVAAYKVLHHILFYDGDMTYTVIQSKTRKEAVKRLKKLKNLFNYSYMLKEVFGVDFGMSTAETWREDKVILQGGHTIESIGNLAQSRGLKEDDCRVTLLVLDDPEDEENTKTIDRMDDNFRKLLTGLETLDKRDSQIVIIGTPLNAQCMVKRLENAEGWVTKIFPACDENTKECLWEEYEPFEELMQKKKEALSVGMVSTFYSEKMCTISGDEEQAFKEKDLRFWDGYVENVDGENFLHITHLNKVELPEEDVRAVEIYIGVDPASSENSRSDYSTTVPVAYDEYKNIFALDYYEKQVLPPVHAEQILEKIKELQPKRVHVESVSYQESLRNTLQNRLAEEGIYQLGLNKKWTPRREKDTRLTDMVRFTASHKLHVKEKHRTLIAELTMFPRGRKNLLDGMWYATRIMREPNHIYGEIKTKIEKVTDKAISWMGR